MPVVVFLCAFFGVYFTVCLLRACFRALAWCGGYFYGLADSLLEGKPLRALGAFLVVLVVAVSLSR